MLTFDFADVFLLFYCDTIKKMHLKALLMVYKINKFSDILFVNLLFPEPRDFAKFYRTLHSHPSFQNGEALKQLYVLKTNGLKASRSTDSFLLH